MSIGQDGVVGLRFKERRMKGGWRMKYIRKIIHLLHTIYKCSNSIIYILMVIFIFERLFVVDPIY